MSGAATLLADHVTFRLTSVDRVAIAGYIPNLAHEGGLVQFLLHRASLLHRDVNIPSPALLAHNHDRLVRAFDAFVAASGLEAVRFHKGVSKELTARPFQDTAEGEGRYGVVFIGKAQERTDIWAGFKDRRSPLSIPSHPHFAFTRQSRVPDTWYFYLLDPDWGPAMVKLTPYAPYPMWIVANGHEWLKRQLDRAGVGYRALDNGLAAVEDPALAHRLAARLTAGHLRAAIDRWLAPLPSPLLDADRRAGFAYSFSVRQLEISDTAVFDRPQRGRAFFEAAIRDHLDLGRPEQVALVVDRQVRTRGPHRTPGRFETRVVTKDVHPQIRIRYKAETVKAYFKEGKALRVETTVNNAADFDLKKTLNAANWRALRHLGAEINERFLDALTCDQAGLPDPGTLAAVVLPSTHDGQRAPGLRFGEPRTMALLAALASFGHVCAGLTNASLRQLMAELFDPAYRTAQATYDLRRLRLKGLIVRAPGTHTYWVTSYGRRIATFLTKLAARVVVPALTALESPATPPRRPPALAAAWRAYEAELNDFIAAAALAA